MLGSCNYLYENDNRCNKTYSLHGMIFRDPYAPSHLILIDLCKWHYEEIIGEMTERTRQFQMKLSNLISEAARLRKIARESDIYVSNTITQLKIEDLKALIKKIQNQECRNFFCMQNLQSLDQSQKLYSVNTFKPGGRRHYTFYYCSLKCFNIMKAKCGMLVPILKGQSIL